MISAPLDVSGNQIGSRFRGVREQEVGQLSVDKSRMTNEPALSLLLTCIVRVDKVAQELSMGIGLDSNNFYLHT